MLLRIVMNMDDIRNRKSSKMSQDSLVSDGQSSLERRLSRMLSVANLNKLLKIRGETRRNLIDDDDDLEGEMERLHAVELELSQQLDQFSLSLDGENDSFENRREYVHENSSLEEMRRNAYYEAESDDGSVMNFEIRDASLGYDEEYKEITGDQILDHSSLQNRLKVSPIAAKITQQDINESLGSANGNQNNYQRLHDSIPQHKSFVSPAPTGMKPRKMKGSLGVSKQNQCNSKTLHKPIPVREVIAPRVDVRRAKLGMNGSNGEVEQNKTNNEIIPNSVPLHRYPALPVSKNIEQQDVFELHEDKVQNHMTKMDRNGVVGGYKSKLEHKSTSQHSCLELPVVERVAQQDNLELQGENIENEVNTQASHISNPLHRSSVSHATVEQGQQQQNESIKLALKFRRRQRMLLSEIEGLYQNQKRTNDISPSVDIISSNIVKRSLMSDSYKTFNSSNINSRRLLADPDRFVAAIAYLRLRNREEDIEEEDLPIANEDSVSLVASKLFGRKEYKSDALYHESQFCNGLFERSWEGTASILITTSLFVAFSFEQNSTLRVWSLLSLPPVFAYFATKVPSCDDDLSLAFVILCLRILLGCTSKASAD